MCIFFLLTGFLLTGFVRAQPVSKVAGELVSAGQATINGIPATSGSTVFTKNRIGTAKEGAAIINFGKIGRLSLGSSTDLTLRLLTSEIGGELRHGRIMVSAPAGVAISFFTAGWILTADGQKATTLTIEFDSKHARFLNSRGEVKIVSSGVVEHVEEGTEMVLEERSGRWERQSSLVDGSQSQRQVRFTSGRQMSGRIGWGREADGWELIRIFFGLLNAGINYSMGRQIAGDDHKTDLYFDTAITCRDLYTLNCRRRGRFSP